MPGSTRVLARAHRNQSQGSSAVASARGQIIVHHKINAVFICCRHGRPCAGVIKVRVKILSAVRHVVGHQVDIVEKGAMAFIDPVFRTFRIGPNRNRDQFFCPKAARSSFSRAVKLSRSAGVLCDQPPCAVYRVLPVKVDPVQTVFLNNLLRRADKHRAALFGGCWARNRGHPSPRRKAERLNSGFVYEAVG